MPAESIYLSKIKEDLGELYQNAGDPIAVLLQTMETSEFKRVIPESMAREAKEKLQKVTFDDANQFIERVIEAALPVFNIIKKKKGDLPKQSVREMFTQEDVRKIVELIRDAGFQKIFVVGNVGCGKTTFSRELAKELNYKNIDVDKFFQIFRQEHGRDVKDLSELVDFIMNKERPPFVINHADLLRQNLVDSADVVVYLNPKREEQIKTRELRLKNNVDGDWREMTDENYDWIIKENSDSFDKLNGELAYVNEGSGTAVKLFK